jgi:cell wall-associated NlpC family hydrolase
LKYDDLLNIPYKPHGRSKKEGFDCYGLAVEMCRRAGTPLKDLYDIATLPTEKVNDYINGGVNVRKINEPKIGGLVEFTHKGHLHVAYIVERGKVIHATSDKGVKISPIGIMKTIAFYEVTNESDTV